MPSLRLAGAAVHLCFLACIACTLALFDGAFHPSLSPTAGLTAASLFITAFAVLRCGRNESGKFAKVNHIIDKENP